MRQDRPPVPEDQDAASTEDEDPGTVHPVEPAEGARDPGTNTTPERAGPPSEPAEGDRG